MGWTYDSSLKTQKDQVRFLIRDIVSTNQLVSDEEIIWALSTEANIYTAAALCAEQIGAKQLSSGNVKSKSVGGLSISYGGNAEEWKGVAERLRARGSSHMIPTAGGISAAERDAFWEDSDVIQPTFYAGLQQDPTNPPLSPASVEDEEE